MYGGADRRAGWYLVVNDQCSSGLPQDDLEPDECYYVSIDTGQGREMVFGSLRDAETAAQAVNQAHLDGVVIVDLSDEEFIELFIHKLQW